MFQLYSAKTPISLSIIIKFHCDYSPLFLVFLIISLLLPMLLYTSYTLHGLYLALGEAYIDVSTGGNILLYREQVLLRKN